MSAIKEVTINLYVETRQHPREFLAFLFTDIVIILKYEIVAVFRHIYLL